MIEVESSIRWFLQQHLKNITTLQVKQQLATEAIKARTFRRADVQLLVICFNQVQR